MNIIYAAEKPSIAGILSDLVCVPIDERDIEVHDNPDETGSFFIGFELNRYVLSPAGEIALESLELVE